MSGALIVEASSAIAPAVAQHAGAGFVIRAVDIGTTRVRRRDEHVSRSSMRLAAKATTRSTGCSRSTASCAPKSRCGPGERQFWRIVNAAPDRYVDVEVPDQRFEVIAL